jgi:hypothetical protein
MDLLTHLRSIALQRIEDTQRRALSEVYEHTNAMDRATDHEDAEFFAEQCWHAQREIDLGDEVKHARCTGSLLRALRDLALHSPWITGIDVADTEMWPECGIEWRQQRFVELSALWEECAEETDLGAVLSELESLWGISANHPNAGSPEEVVFCAAVKAIVRSSPAEEAEPEPLEVARWHLASIYDGALAVQNSAPKQAPTWVQERWEDIVKHHAVVVEIGTEYSREWADEMMDVLHLMSMGDFVAFGEQRIMETQG